MQQGYGGIHIWAVDLDDYDGKMCGGEGRYPLISLMKKLLTNEQSSGQVLSSHFSKPEMDGPGWSEDKIYNFHNSTFNLTIAPFTYISSNELIHIVNWFTWCELVELTQQ